MRIIDSYAQKFLGIIHFPIADIGAFFQVNDCTRKRRTTEYLGSRGWASVRSRELRASEDRQDGRGVRGRLPPAGGANRPALIVARVIPRITRSG